MPKFPPTTTLSPAARPSRISTSPSPVRPVFIASKTVRSFRIAKTAAFPLSSVTSACCGMTITFLTASVAIVIRANIPGFIRCPGFAMSISALKARLCGLIRVLSRETAPRNASRGRASRETATRVPRLTAVRLVSGISTSAFTRSISMSVMTGTPGETISASLTNFLATTPEKGAIITESFNLCNTIARLASASARRALASSTRLEARAWAVVMSSSFCREIAFFS